MTTRMREIASEIVALQAELDREIERRRKALGVSIHDRLVRFEQGIALEHRRLRTGAATLLARSSFMNNVSAPVIYSLIVPLLLLDAWIRVYQAICFRVYRIPPVRRGDYIVFDRGQLSYLNWIEALNCAYCAYANGLIGYVREVASRTEQYWCPIKHALRVSDPHRRYYEFLEYGDAEGYRHRLAAFRQSLREEDENAASQPDAARDHPAATS